MVRMNTKATRKLQDEKTPSSGDNESLSLPSIHSEAGKHSRTSDLLLRIAESLSLELMNYGQGNTAEQAVKEVMSVCPLFIVTPRLLFLLESFNKQYHQNNLSYEARRAKYAQQVAEAGETATATEGEWHTTTEDKGAKDPSMSFYNSLREAGDTLATFSLHRQLDCHKVGDHVRLPTLVSNAS